MGKLSPALLMQIASSSPTPISPAPNPGQFYLPVSLPVSPSRSLLLARFCYLSPLLCTCMHPARAGEEPAAAFSPSLPPVKH